MFCLSEKSIYFCGIKTYMKETTNTGLIDLILDGGVLADEAMYHLLHHRLNHQLRQRFEVYEHRLLDGLLTIGHTLTNTTGFMV